MSHQAKGHVPVSKVVADAELDSPACWAGFDPYDGLTGTRLPGWAVSRRRARQAVVQLRKRSPVDLGPVLGIRPRVIAKAQACFLMAESRLETAQVPGAGDRLTRAQDIVTAMRLADGNHGDGAWGYEFDVQTRWAYYNAGSPNLIATVFVGRGFGEAATAFNASGWLNEAAFSAGYLAQMLVRTFAKDRIFFAYTLDSPRLIHNANLLGAALVAMLGVLETRPQWIRLGLDAAATTIAAQLSDGSWPYGEGPGLGWSDNFHTAYNLDGLLLLWLASGDTVVLRSLRQGLEHWVNSFFGPRGEPKYRPDKPYPFDIHSAATAIDTAARLATWGFPTADLAWQVAAWTQANLIDPLSGRTYFQQHRLFTDRRSFVRWGQAHWALASSSLAMLKAGVRSPLESAVAGQSGVSPLGQA